MHYWKVKALPLRVRTYDQARKEVLEIFKELKGKSKRKLSIKSRYFNKDKVFLDFFWDHLLQKPLAQRKDRLRFMPCALELIHLNTLKPSVKTNPHKPEEQLYRFYGKTPQGSRFVVQLKKTAQGSLQFMSAFPTNKKTPLM